LLVVSLIWGSAFVAQRIAALQVGVFLFNGLRFLLGALVLLPFALWGKNQERSLPATPKDTLAGILMAGGLMWAGAALQQAGLQHTTAGNAGFITGLYVVFTPLLLALVPRQKPQPHILAAALLAVVGLFLLSTGGRMRLNPGDILELTGAVFWALHIILIGWLVKRVVILRLAIGQYLVCGLLSLLTGLIVESHPWQGLLTGWWAIVYTGALSVGLGYTLQAAAQRVAPPSDAAIFLSMEAVFAALFGWLFLAETLTVLQSVGCAVMLAGMLLAQARAFSEGKA
jgi:drug/metabolite transporter (DMT)-like permease